MRFVSSMSSEIEKLSRRPKYADDLSALLVRLLNLHKGSTREKRLLRYLCSLQLGQLSSVTDSSIRSLYRDLCFSLNHDSKFETSVTTYEWELSQFFRANIKKKVLSTVWIGNHNVDFFFPTIGIAVEVNGGIHFNERKMKKDDLRDLTLKRLKIPVMEIENEDIQKAKKWLNSLNDIPHLGTVRCRYLWRRIAIETIVSNCEIGSGF